jgi:aspartate carbamoyltransferase catalytic subunit
LAKGESLYDTLKTFESLGVDIAVIRHSDDNFVQTLREDFNFSTINAGAGKNEHPSQSLLDLFTIKEEFGSFDGLKFVYVVISIPRGWQSQILGP